MFIVVEMEALKYAPSWGLRHRRDSVSGMSVHSQPFGYGGMTGMASPAPTYHSQGNLLWRIFNSQLEARTRITSLTIFFCEWAQT